jgi:hypothetical protein
MPTNTAHISPRLFVLVLLLSAAATPLTAADRPNILIILADDKYD